MYTQCPLCDTQYRISAVELKAALGKVRCAHCHSVFNALSHLTDTPPEIPTLTQSVAALVADIAAELNHEGPMIQTLHTLEMPDHYGLHSETVTPDEHIPDITDAMPALAPAEDAADSTKADAQSTQSSRLNIPDLIGAPARLMADEFSYPRKKPYGGLGTALWSVGIILLLALLVLQYVYATRNDLARTAELRPMLAQLCAVVPNFARCEIPLQRDLTRIELQGQSISPHPQLQNAVLVSVTLLNKASFAQPYPALELTLVDFNGALIARRRFQPAEYLFSGANISQGMSPQGVVLVTLEMVTPAAPLNLDLTSWSFALF